MWLFFLWKNSSLLQWSSKGLVLFTQLYNFIARYAYVHVFFVLVPFVIFMLSKCIIHLISKMNIVYWEIYMWATYLLLLLKCGSMFWNLLWFYLLILTIYVHWLHIVSSNCLKPWCFFTSMIKAMVIVMCIGKILSTTYKQFPFWILKRTWNRNHMDIFIQYWSAFHPKHF